MTGPIARIIARWAASALVTYGFISPEYGSALDTDLALVLGSVLGFWTEAAYVFAKRKGWTT